MNIPTAKRMADLSEYFFASLNTKLETYKKSQNSRPIINLGIGNPDLPPHPAVIETLKTESEKPDAHTYPPYNGLPELRQALAAWYQREHAVELDPETQVFPTTGSKQGIAHFTLAVVDRGDRVLVPNPGYATYAKASHLAGGEVVEYPLKEENNFLPDLHQLENLDLTNVKVLWINYPNNPTGASASKEDLKQILLFARRHNMILASDNPYSHTTFTGQPAPSILEIAEPDDLVIEFNSLSKTYNMAGMRIGWAVGHPTLITLLSTVNSNIETGIFRPLQKAATAALTLPNEWIVKKNNIYKKRRQKLHLLLEKIGCSVFPSQATLYLWAKIPEGEKRSEDFVFSLLYRTGIFITPGTAFGSQGEGYVRVACCQSLEVIEKAARSII